MARDEIPHLRFPFRRGANGKVETVEQDTPEHVESCVWCIAMCSAGYRLERPEFGWPFPTFRAAPVNLEALIAAIQEFEPRADVTMREMADLADEATRNVEIDIPVDMEGF